MSSFYYNRYSQENYYSQWKKYIQNESFINDITSSISNQTKDLNRLNFENAKSIKASISRQTEVIRSNIQNASQEQINVIQKSTEAICGVVETGFDTINNSLGDIEFELVGIKNELSRIANILDWNFSVMIEQQRLSNLLLSNIALLLRIPDIQKERQYYIEKGILFLKNSILEKEFYTDALSNFKKAENIEPTDPFVLHRLGFIYLYSDIHLNIELAEEYFIKAGKYGIADLDIRNDNILRQDANSSFNNQVVPVQNKEQSISESFLFAGRCAYIQGKHDSAINFTQKSIKYNNSCVEAKFLEAKCLCAKGEPLKAIPIIDDLVIENYIISIQIISDLDFSSKPEIADYLESLKSKKHSTAVNLLQECKSLISPFSIVTKEVEYFENKLNESKSFLSSSKIIKNIQTKKERTFSEAFSSTSKDKFCFNDYNLNIIKDKLQLIKETLKFPERQSIRLKVLFNYLAQNTQWDLPQIDSIRGAMNFSNGYKSKTVISDLLSFVKKENEYYKKYSNEVKRIEDMFNDMLIDDTSYIESRKELSRMSSSIVEVDKQVSKNNILEFIKKLFK